MDPSKRKTKRFRPSALIPKSFQLAPVREESSSNPLPVLISAEGDFESVHSVTSTDQELNCKSTVSDTEPSSDNDIGVFPEAAAKTAKLKFYEHENGKPLQVSVPLSLMKLAGNHGMIPPPPIEQAFVGAVLAGCVTINRFIMDGTFGRGWEATYKNNGQSKRVFVKTLGNMTESMERNPTSFASKERSARVEAAVMLHKWFPAAVDQPGTVSARLCYGSLAHQSGVVYGNIFFICGELCARGELWEYHPYKTAFKEKFSKRIFGQLARAILKMKYCSQAGDGYSSDGWSGPGCFHRDIKMENVLLNDDFDCKITDYGSLKFTDGTVQRTSPGGTNFHLANTPGLGTDTYRPPSFFYKTSSMLQTQGYDPAGWDVWSLGVILLFLSAADYIASSGASHGRPQKRGGLALAGDAYNMMLYALQEWDRNGQESFELWNQARLVVGPSREGVFYETDEYGIPRKTDINKMPIIDRDAEGVPKNKNLWLLLKEIDPDCPDRNGDWTSLSPHLKNLLNRMLDVDPRSRITIEEVCDHPWLSNYQAPGPSVPPRAVETDQQRAAYTTEMLRRYVLYIKDTKSKREHTISGRRRLSDVEEVLNRCLRRGMFIEKILEGDMSKALADEVVGAMNVMVPVPQLKKTTLLYNVFVTQEDVRLIWPTSTYKGRVADWVRFTRAMEQGLFDLSHSTRSSPVKRSAKSPQEHPIAESEP